MAKRIVMEMKILDPRGEGAKVSRSLAARVSDLNGKVLGLHSNHNANVDLLMDKLEGLLTGRINLAKVLRGEESELTEDCDALVTGVGL